MKNSLYIITGCSKGLGKALVDELVSSHENLVIGVSRTEMEETDNFRHIKTDLGNGELLVSQMDRIFPEAEFKNIFLINNAGWIGEISPLGKLDPAGIQQIHAINLVAPAIMMNEFVKRCQSQGGKRIVVNISSGAAGKAIDGWSGYCSSKAGLNQLTLVAEEESRQKQWGIKYYSLSPGLIDTAMQDDIRSSSQDNFSNIEKFKSYKSENKLTSPEAVATKVIYLMNHSDQFDEVLQDVREF